MTDTAVESRIRIAYGPGPRFVEIDRGHGPSTTPAIGVVLLHGGFWRREQTVAGLHAVVDDLARHGLTVGNVEYRSIEEGGTWPHCLDDVVRALDVFAEATGIPLDRTVVVGHSAGGQLALLCAYRVPGPAAVLALAPVSDLQAAVTERLGDDAVLGLLADVPAADRDAALRAASPMQQRGRPACRQVVMHGSEDQTVPVRHSRQFADHPDHDIRLVEIAGARHMHLVKPDRAAWPAVRAELLALVGETVGG